MTLQQLEYIVSLDNHRRFSIAAEKCFVSQPTLSALIMKLEDELGVKIFDRSKQPVVPTDIGAQVIAQARKVLESSENLRQIVRDQCDTLSGELRLAIIPTLAPYLLPLFLKSFSEKFPDVKLHISELTTDVIVHHLKHDLLDVAIMATPTQERMLFEDPLFFEEFVVYAPMEQSLLQKRYVLPDDIDVQKLLLLEEGHCVRAQVVNLCALQKAQSALSNITYEAGSLETLRRLVENNSGITILPHMAILDLDEDKMQYVRFFKDPAPVREISLVTHRAFAKKRLIDALKQEVMMHLPPHLRQDREKVVLSIKA